MSKALLDQASSYAFLHNFDCEDETCKCSTWLKVEVDRELIKLLKNGESLLHIMLNGKKCETWREVYDKMDRIKKLDCPPNTVAVVGYPKSGSHLLISILDELGVTSTEDYDLVSRDPLAYQRNLKSYDVLENTLKSKSHLWMMPHCHYPPEHFPQNFKGKILFIERDIRAIAVSAYHMFSKVGGLKDYIEKYELHDIDTFARHMFEGKNLYGCPAEYNKDWKKFASENPINVLWLKYEDIREDKGTHVKRIAEFLGINNYNLKSVIKNSEIDNAKARRKKRLAQAGFGFYDHSTYRTGKINSWEESLSAETLRFYEKCYKL